MVTKRTDTQPQISRKEQERLDGIAAVEAGQAALQAQFDQAETQGFHGVAVDETPRENYSVSGVTAAKPTPETVQ